MSKLERIVFVVGASRSGTTMLNRILGQHPSICAMNELHYFGDLFEIGRDRAPLKGDRLLKVAAKLFARYRRGLWHDRPEAEDIRSARSLVKEREENGTALFHRFLEQVADRTGASLVAEQTPRNIYYAADLLQIYPDALILHMVRDPRAVMASQKRRWSRRKALQAKNIPLREMAREWISYHPFTMSLLWKKAFTAGRKIDGDERYLRVRFEDLVENPREVVGRICQFLGVRFHEGMLDIPQIDSSVRTMDNRAMGIRKSSVEAWKSVLSSGEVFLVERRLAAEMQELGYRAQCLGIRRKYLSCLPVIFRFPLHLAGTFLINPQRFLIQLKGVMLGK